MPLLKQLLLVVYLVYQGRCQYTSSENVVDLTRAVVSGYDGVRVDYDDISGVIDRLTVNITTATHAVIPNRRLGRGRQGEPYSSLCGLPTAVFFTSDTLEMSDVQAFERKTKQRLPHGGAVIVIFPAASSANTPFNSLQMQSAMRSGVVSSKQEPAGQSSQAASIAATGVIQTMTLMRSRDVISRDVARYLAVKRNISVFGTNAHYLDHVSKHANTLERFFLSEQVIIVRSLATPGLTASKWLQNSRRFGNNLNSYVFVYEPVPARKGSSVKFTQQKSLNQKISSQLPQGGRLALAGLVLSSPRRKFACLSLSALNNRAIDSRVYRPIQTGFSTEVEMSFQLRSPGYTYLSTPSGHQFQTASIPDELKFGTCAKMPILVTRGVASVVSVANLIDWENERRKGVTGSEQGAWVIDDQAILFQVVSVGQEPPPNELGVSPTKLFIEPEVFTWLRRSRNVRVFGFDHQLDSILGNKHEIESILSQLEDAITIYNIYNLQNIRTAKTFTYSGVREKRNANLSSSRATGCNQFQCAFISLRLWPANLAPVQLFAVSDLGIKRTLNVADISQKSALSSSFRSLDNPSVASKITHKSATLIFLLVSMIIVS